MDCEEILDRLIAGCERLEELLRDGAWLEYSNQKKWTLFLGYGHEEVSAKSIEALLMKLPDMDKDAMDLAA